MAAVKRPARKSSSSTKAKTASGAKKSMAPARRKVASKKAAPKKVATTTSRKAPTKAKSAAKTTATKKQSAAKVTKTAKATVKAASPKAKAKESKKVRETVVRTAPGVVKTSGGKRATRSRKSTQPTRIPYDPDALIHGVRPYRLQPGEPYMNTAQRDHFRQILQAWKRELMEEVDRTVHHMQDEASNFPDPNDRATQESEFGLELRTRDRERKLLKKITAALERIDDGSYGYCEETGEEIGLRRLEARPVATLSVEAQERRELSERQYGERDDRYR
ncbi:MAG: RNA polymerase-binding protein DksA [Gammaproteobacteria bacterium]